MAQKRMKSAKDVPTGVSSKIITPTATSPNSKNVALQKQFFAQARTNLGRSANYSV